MDDMWTWKDPRIVRCWSKWRTLWWKAFLMRKRSLIVSAFEIFLPVIFALQIRLIFEPLALNIQDIDFKTREDILSKIPEETNYHYAPHNEFTKTLMNKASTTIQRPIRPATDERELVTSYYAKNQSKPVGHVLWVIFEDNSMASMARPKKLTYKMRARLTEEIENDADSYVSQGFMAVQMALETAFIEMWTSKSPLKFIANMTMGHFPYYRIHFPMLPSTVRPNISLIYYLTIVGFLLIPMATLYKAIHDKATGFKALMRMLGFHPKLMYLGWIDYLMITALPATIICSWILSPVYSHSGPFVLGMFFLLYIIMSSIFVFTIGTFFVHSIKAVLASAIAWMFLAHMTIILDESIINEGLGIRAASLLLPHSGLIYGLVALTSRSKMNDLSTQRSALPIAFDSRKVDTTNDKDRITVELIFLFWTFHIVLWYYVGVYLENICPGKFGTKKAWYYPCKKTSKPADIFVTFRGSTNWSAVERAPMFAQAKVRLRKVTMKYGISQSLEVLRDISLDFYPSEFSVILGHNGAGKSSLLKIMTGMYKATHGKVYIEGRDYSDDDMSEYQKESYISYCPQENILVNYLTAFEHIQLFGMMKGLNCPKSKQQAIKLIKVLKLEKEKNFMIEKLTFGAKRKLCLAMALIGQSEVLILDEPTYGLDPQNRENVWNLLSNYKKSTTIIMATNSMKAADSLADRIAIIANGRIECCGSKIFLNRRYGIGYDLRIILTKGCNTKALHALIQEYSSTAVTFRGTTGMIARFNISGNTRFSKLFSFLNANKVTLSIRGFKLNQPSIEGQFVRIGLSRHFRERGVSFPMSRYELVVQKRRKDLIHSGRKWNHIVNKELCRQQIIAMFYKKYMHVSSSWKMYVFSIIFSIMTLVLMMMVSDLSYHPQFSSLKLDLNITTYTSRNFLMLYHFSSSDFDAQKLFNSVQSVARSYGNSKFDVTKNFSAAEIMIHPDLHSIHLRDRYFMSLDILPDNKIKVMYSPVATHSGPIALNFYHNALLKYSTDDEDLKIHLKSQPLIDPHDWQHRIVHQKSVKNWENAVIIITLFLTLPTIELGVIEARSLTKQLQFNTHGVTPLVYWLPIYLVDLLIYLISIFIVSGISLAIYPWKNSMSSTNAGNAFLILFAYGSTAISMGYCIQIFINPRGTVYLSILAINFFTILTMNPTILFPIILNWLTEPLQILIEVILHGVPPYVLACAIGNYIGINLYNGQCFLENNCENEFSIEDPCCQNCGDDICYEPLNAMLDNQSGSVFFHSVASDVLIMFLQTLCFHLVLYFYESKRYNKIKPIDLSASATNDLDEDAESSKNNSDDENEKENLNERSKEIVEEVLINNCLKNIKTQRRLTDTAVKIENLSQMYAKKEIITGINIQINRGECFGLLGMNGTGKSTMIRTLTGQIPIESGRVMIYGVDLSQNPDKFLGMTGYCPQNNGLLEFMSGRQNMRFFAAIRGVPRKFIEEEMDKWLDVFDLLDFENVNIKDCAWGIKRKISLLRTLIGNPEIIFLDEPASGMDVITRYALIETLYEVKEMGATICLTTHSVEEAEALCDSIGFLIAGKLVRSGTPEEIKQSADDKISMKIVLSREVDEGPLKMALTAIFPTAKFVERRLNWMIYELSGTVTYEDVYEAGEKLKIENRGVVDYFVNKRSLEHVFQELSAVEPLVDDEKSFLQWILIKFMTILRRK